MKHLVVGSAFLALLTGCSDGEPSASNNGTRVEARADDPRPALPAGEEGLRRYAECSVILDAMGNLYTAIASQNSGAEKAEMEASAAERSASAGDYHREAVRIAGTLPNRSATDVVRIKTERNARLEQEQASQDFGAFAIMLGREADNCEAIAPRA
jgi:hypothetical protein